MSKILSTQMTGLFQRIINSEEEAIEETSRLLVQASVGQGKVYFACFEEMQPIEFNALHSAEPFTNLHRWSPEIELTDSDRVCIFTSNAANPEAVLLAKKLYKDFIPFSVVASEPQSEDNELSELAYTYVSMKVRGGILPHPINIGERVVIPYLMAGLFIYEAIKLNYDEMLGDDDSL